MAPPGYNAALNRERYPAPTGNSESTGDGPGEDPQGAPVASAPPAIEEVKVYDTHLVYSLLHAKLCNGCKDGASC